MIMSQSMFLISLSLSNKKNEEKITTYYSFELETKKSCVFVVACVHVINMKCCDTCITCALFRTLCKSTN